MTAGILLWIHRFANKKVVVFCDNKSVVGMINSSGSRCKNCMMLIRLIVLYSMIFNVRVKAKWVPGKSNTFADLLSRMRIKDFWKEVEKQEVDMNEWQTELPEEIWPMEKVWYY